MRLATSWPAPKYLNVDEVSSHSWLYAPVMRKAPACGKASRHASALSKSIFIPCSCRWSTKRRLVNNNFGRWTPMFNLKASGWNTTVHNQRKSFGAKILMRPMMFGRARMPRRAAAPGIDAATSWRSSMAASALRFCASNFLFDTAARRVCRAASNWEGVVFHFFAGASSTTANSGGKSI